MQAASLAPREQRKVASRDNDDRESTTGLIEPSSPMTPTVTSDAPANQQRRKSYTQFLKRNKGPKERKASLSDSGPYIVETDPDTGKTTCRVNPHWPYEDAWKTEGQGFQGTTAGMIIPDGVSRQKERKMSTQAAA